jgi:hypothetical protein
LANEADIKTKKMKERERVLTSASLITLVALSLLGFNQKVKNEAFHKQGCTCPVCKGSHKQWEAHHCLPKSLGGRDTLENCAVVGGDKDKDCHEVLDQLALKKSLIYNPSEDRFIEPTEVPEEMGFFHRIFHHSVKKHHHNKYGR